MATIQRCDVAIAGAGLAGGLIALALRRRHPALDVRLVDAAASAGGNHVWSFFASDIADADRWLVEPLVGHRWPAYDVAFPAHARTIAEPYHSIDSARFDAVLHDALPQGALMLRRQVVALTPTTIVLGDGERIEAAGVIDARGAGDLAALELGWQKFVGRELALARPHGRERPVVMDATVAQHDGYRFVYCLPFSARRMFVEDTYYSDTPDLDPALLGSRIDDYAANRGWSVAAVEREETGVLPVVLGGDFARYWHSGGQGIAKAGVRAGLFHATTSYSLPDAVRTADMISRRSDFTGTALHAATLRHAERHWADQRFYRLLDRMLFRAAEPVERYRVLERFYRLDPMLIGRFYAGRSTWRDKMRILAGKPPVPVRRAVRALIG